MQCVRTILSVACPALQYFSTLSHKWHSSQKKVTEHKICILIFSTTFVWNISHSKKNWATYDQNCIGLHVNYLVFLSDFNRTWSFCNRFLKNNQISNFMEICLVGTELFHEDRWVDGHMHMTKLIVAFWNFANTPNNWK
jgi:hypothetical protein